MSAFPRPARVYIWSLSLLAAILLLTAVYLFEPTSASFGTLLLFGLLSVSAGLFPVVLPRKLVEITVGVAINIAAVILFPFALAILIPTLGAVATELLQRRVWYKSVFNMAQTIVTYSALSLLATLIYPAGIRVEDAPNWIAALLVIGAGYYLLNTTIVVTVIALTSRVSFWYIWRTNLRSITWHQVSMVCTGFLIAMLWQIDPRTIVLILLPVVILRHAMSLGAQLETQTYEAIEALVDAIDSRDTSTYQHSERVATYARSIALQMDLPQQMIEQIAISARLHDLGKVAITDAWLHKQGPLTEEERSAFQKHAPLGADIVARFSVLGAESALVHSHHERWDGGGYPDGLRQAQIPLGARIIAAADAFDAMTSDRPYRRALSAAEARLRLAQCAGSQFDPTVVEAALRVLPTAIPTRATRATPPVAAPVPEEVAAPVSMAASVVPAHRKSL